MRTKLVTLFLISVIALLMAAPVLANDEQPELLPEEIFEELGFPVEPSIPGRIEGAGTYFEIKDSEYLNITLKSSEEIKVVLESIPRMISLNIEVAKEGIDVAELTFEGLEPNKSYYKYQDSYKNEAVFISDENGTFSWTQDLTQSHHIWLQEEKGTTFIDKDTVLDHDILGSVEITANNITLDCNGHKIIGSGTGYGIYLNNKSGVTIQNCIVTKFSTGIFLYSSSNNQLTNNTANSNDNRGVSLYYSSNNTLTNITAGYNYWIGIYLYYSSSNQFINNIAYFSHDGIILSSSSNNTLTGITSNSNQEKGIYLASSSKNTLTNITANSNFYGIWFSYSANNTLTNITANSNGYGIYLYYSSNNNRLTNIIANSNNYGIYLGHSSNNQITNNIANINFVGILLDSSLYNKIYLNNFINNTKNAYSYKSFNLWNSPQKINYIYNTNKYTNYLGNYWSDYNKIDVNNDGIGDIPYVFTGGYDLYPLMASFENYFEVPVNQPPTITNLGQFKSDGMLSITEGNITTESTVVFKATLSDPDNDQAKFQVELRQTSELFTGIDDGGILSSNFVDSGSEAIITRAGLIDGKYHWRARAIDSQGNISDWQEFGTTGNIDFEVKLVPFYTQVESPYPSSDETKRWFKEQYGNGNYDCKDIVYKFSTIRSCGCAITSMVMLGRYYDIDVAIDRNNVDPGNINTWLTNNKGYTFDGRLWWGKAVEYLGFIDEATGKRMVRLNFNPYTDYNVPFVSPRIDNYVNSAKPIVAYSEKFGHYFIVDNKFATTYGIKDPAWYNTKTLNDSKNLANKVQSYSNYFSKANLFSYLETPKPITSSLHLYLASPAELLITDPTGRRLGKDPIAGIVYNEIPDSIYTKEDPIVSSDIPLDPDEMHESKVIYISSPIDGEYDIQVIGIDSGIYALDFSTYNNIGESTDASFEAVTDTGVISDYSIDYSGVPEEPTIIKRIVTIEDVIIEIEISHQLNLIDNNGIKNSLIKKLNNAQRQIESNRKNTTTNILNAFINEVEAQKEKHIDLDTAELLIKDAQYIIEHL